MSTDLVSWLRSHLDADEKIARAADQGPWIVGTLSTNINYDGREGVIGEITVVDGERWPKPMTVRGSHVASKPAEGNGRMIADMARGYVQSRHEANADHVVAQDPTRTLRTVAAHRAILDAYVEADEWYSKNKSAPAGEVHGLRTAVLLVAAIFESRPGFDPSWRAE